MNAANYFKGQTRQFFFQFLRNAAFKRKGLHVRYFNNKNIKLKITGF